MKVVLFYKNCLPRYGLLTKTFFWIILFLAFVLSVRYASASTINYEVWRNTVNSSASATRVADFITATSFDDVTASSGVTYYYWIKAKNVEVASVVSPIDGFYGSFRQFSATLYCPTKAKRGSASELITKIEFYNTPYIIGGAVAIRCVEVDSFSDDQIFYRNETGPNWWINYPGINTVFWTNSAVISNYETSSDNQAEVQLQVQHDGTGSGWGRVPANDYARTGEIPVNLVDNYDAAPSGISASAQNGFIRITWNSSSGLSSFSAVSSAQIISGYTLAVQCSGANDATICSSTADVTGKTCGTTPFSFRYLHGNVVLLNAPLQVGNWKFSRWTGDVDYQNGNYATITNMDRDRTITAEYGIVLFSDDFESGNLNQWATTTSTTTALDISTAQDHTIGNGKSAQVTNSLNKMYHNLGTEMSGHSRATFWIYDNTQTRAYGETRGYSGSGNNDGGLQQLFAIGKYNTVTMTNEVFDGSKYQGRVVSGEVVGWFNLNAPGAPRRSAGWHKFEIERLADGTTIDYYVDGILSRRIIGAASASWDSITIGSVAAGATTGDAWFDDVKVEYFGSPSILMNPSSVTAYVGDTVSFTISATTITSYEWRRNGIKLNNGGRISGADSAVLQISDVRFSDQANYSVIVKNSLGSLLSSEAQLTVINIPPARLGPLLPLSDGSYELSISSLPARAVEIQATTNFVNWTSLGIVTNEIGIIQFIDNDAKDFNRRFYRGLMLPNLSGENGFH